MPGCITALPFIYGIFKYTFPSQQKSNSKEEPPKEILYSNGKVPIKNAKLQYIKKLMPYIVLKSSNSRALPGQLVT